MLIGGLGVLYHRVPYSSIFEVRKRFPLYTFGLLPFSFSGSCSVLAQRDQENGISQLMCAYNIQKMEKKATCFPFYVIHSALTMALDTCREHMQVLVLLLPIYPGVLQLVQHSSSVDATLEATIDHSAVSQQVSLVQKEGDNL